MQRRDFLKISAVTGATAALDSCGSPERQLIRFIPEEELVPGIEAWKPSVCTLCRAGCGTIARVMEGEAEVIRDGQPGLMKMALAKKLEGNPHHPISQGKLCARGQAGLQITYHPDRVANPLKRTGQRGSGEFAPVSWQDAVGDLVARLTAIRSAGESASLSFVTRPLRGQRRVLIDRFLNAFGAPPALTYEPFDDAVLRWANFLSFDRSQLPTLDLARANYVLCLGADFLGTWNSPVAQSIRYGEMRQGRPGRRAKFVQVEARMSQTGANADEWIPCRPGAEGALALGIAHVIMREHLQPEGVSHRGDQLIAGWAQGLPDHTPEMTEKRTSVSASTLTRLARELSQNIPAVVIIGGAPLAHTNGSLNALAVNALNELLGAYDGDDQGGVIRFTPRPPFETGGAPAPAPGSQGNFSALRALVQEILLDQPHSPKILLVYDANPVFSAPPTTHVREALEKVPFLVSFGSFIDETSVLADLILPDHSPLESWLDDVPESGTAQPIASLAPPAMRPLHNTRAMPDVLLDAAHRLGGEGEVAAALPWKSFDAMLRSAFEPLRHQGGSIESNSSDEFWKKAQQQGGWWSANVPPDTVPAAAPDGRRRGRHRKGARSSLAPRLPAQFTEPEFDGQGPNFPFYFLPYASQAFRDGSLAHLPWLQELPDVLSTAMWCSWVEINPKTAARLHIRQEDLVEVRSQHGALQAPALISPGIAPDVVAMPVGQGHDQFGRYASHRGSNPLAILAPMIEPETGAHAWAATRVRISRVGKGKPVLFAGAMSRLPQESTRR